MIAVDADHLRQRILAALRERREILLVHRVRARVPIPLRPEPALTPEAVLRPEENAQPIARIREGRVMGVMRPADEVEPRLLDQPHVALAARRRDGDAPAGVVL